jgi:ADP-ribosyl-[dinitrogen reductase] hydrolase
MFSTNERNDVKMSGPANSRERVLGGLWGSLVGDALGVPVEFTDRATVQADPVTDMRGFGTHHQPPGTWSDDGALTLCTVDSLLNAEFDIQDMGNRFVQWMNGGLWAATGVVFDIGATTADALRQIAAGTPADRAGRHYDHSNGNGSLMRILPVVLRFRHEPTTQFAARLESASAITHGHAKSKMACVFYGLMVRQLLLGRSRQDSLAAAREEFSHWCAGASDTTAFRRVLQDDFATLPENEVVSSGYVLHTLHASLWALLSTSDFKACLLKAVNLGGDTDTTGCVAGGLAGVHYGLDAIPSKWREDLARQDVVKSLLNRFADLVPPSN